MVRFHEARRPINPVKRTTPAYMTHVDECTSWNTRHTLASGPLIGCFNKLAEYRPLNVVLTVVNPSIPMYSARLWRGKLWFPSVCSPVFGRLNQHLQFIPYLMSTKDIQNGVSTWRDTFQILPGIQICFCLRPFRTILDILLFNTLCTTDLLVAYPIDLLFFNTMLKKGMANKQCINPHRVCSSVYVTIQRWSEWTILLSTFSRFWVHNSRKQFWLWGATDMEKWRRDHNMLVLQLWPMLRTRWA